MLLEAPPAPRGAPRAPPLAVGALVALVLLWALGALRDRPREAAAQAAAMTPARAPSAAASSGGADAAPSAALTTVDGLPVALDIALPAEVCAVGAPVSATVWSKHAAGPAAAIRTPRAALAPDAACVAALPLDPAALRAGELHLVQVCAWGGPRPRCALPLVQGGSPGAPPPDRLAVRGDRWRWAVELPAAEPSPGSGCFAGTPGEIGGVELRAAQLSLAGRSVNVDLTAPSAARALSCALARFGEDLDTRGLGIGATTLAGVLVN